MSRQTNMAIVICEQNVAFRVFQTTHLGTASPDLCPVMIKIFDSVPQKVQIDRSRKLSLVLVAFLIRVNINFESENVWVYLFCRRHEAQHRVTPVSEMSYPLFPNIIIIEED